SDGGDGLPAEAEAALRGMKSLRWVAVWGSEVGQLGGNVGVRVLDDGFLSSEPVHDRGETYLTRWAPNGRREAKRRKVPLRRLDDVDGAGRVLRGYAPGLVSVFEGPDGDWPRLLPGTEADLGDARVFDGTAHWLGHQPGPETDVGARLWVQAEGAPPRASPFPDGVWRNGEVLFLGGPGRAVFVAAKGEGAEPERQLIAWELTDRGRELWRVGGLLHQDQVRCSPDGAYVIALDQDRRRLTCYDGETGRALWSRASSFPSPDLAVIGDGRCAYLSQVTEVTVLALADGELEARWPTRDAPTRLYSVPGTSHLIANAYWRGVLERRDWRTGESAWPLAEQRGEVFALAAGAAGEVYAADGEGIVRWRAGAPERVAAWGLDPDNSASAVRVALGTRWAAALVGRSGSWKTWAFPLTGERAPFSLAELSRGERFEALAVVDDTLLAGSQDELVGFDLARQRVLWRQELANARSACAFPERGPAGALSFLCLWYNGAVFRVDALGGVEALGQLPGRPERAALSGGRLAVALDEGGVWVGEPPTYDRWGDLEEPAALAWHRGRLLGLGARGLTVWEDGFVREALDLEAVNERGTSLLVGPDDRVFVGTAYGSVLVFEPR
ncbi:MAG: PQQ-binding-like beta-propeller repeat protein, partial [Planctomycetes bacterium]|nr:PQQ-binding-like beta-propeller repeat protein [Planctomycetota bacterium]